MFAISGVTYEARDALLSHVDGIMVMSQVRFSPAEETAAMNEISVAISPFCEIQSIPSSPWISPVPDCGIQQIL